MMIILHIETSTQICSVALSEDSNCIFFISNDEGMNHAALLSSFIQQALDMLKSSDRQLNAVAVSSGPGSYTGLRIGVSTAKGICYGLNIPLISVSTLEIMTIEALKRLSTEAEDHYFIPMIDARRMEVYDAVFDAGMNLLRPVTADIITEDSFINYLKENRVYIFGNGSAKCKTLLKSSNAYFIDNIHPLAENMIQPAIKKYKENNFEDVAYFEPFYLKEFQATVPKNKTSSVDPVKKTN
ncbi:MAG: tRNA (adenosine(37)-N6)-threonylcarbamoyltransferase complex dimerization subunit type 1 TsaB [Paludibacter sp.]|nr:tRNA (adenosine(37)-N6)-threonylcarbamoyltransferase complex dimerization subunit type 1 TsaB [Paludibacter sp.]